MTGNSAAKPFNLFEQEELIAAEAATVIRSGNLPQECSLPLGKLLEGYNRLLRDTKQLVKIADHRERDLNRLNKKLEGLTHSLAYQAEHDALTGTLNKAAIGERIVRQLAQSDCSLMLLDIDHFKRVNDSYGHLVGDQILKAVVDRVQEQVRDYDLLGRFGGEEFILLSRQTSLFKARALAELIRRAVADEVFVTDGGPSLAITISVGVTLAMVGEVADQAVGRADQALYLAKANGRNRVEVFERPVD